MHLAISQYEGNNRGVSPEGSRCTYYTYFNGFYGRKWKTQVYPKYVTTPYMCYCPSNPAIQPGTYVGADPWDPWNYLSEDYCFIGYVYTPNNQRVTEDLQGNKFPSRAEESLSVSVLMADSSRLYSAWVDTPYHWNHLLDDPQGGNVMYGGGQVIWISRAQQLLRAEDPEDSYGGTHQHWW